MSWACSDCIWKENSDQENEPLKCCAGNLHLNSHLAAGEHATFSFIPHQAWRTKRTHKTLAGARHYRSAAQQHPSNKKPIHSFIHRRRTQCKNYICSPPCAYSHVCVGGHQKMGAGLIDPLSEKTRVRAGGQAHCGAKLMVRTHDERRFAYSLFMVAAGAGGGAWQITCQAAALHPSVTWALDVRTQTHRHAPIRPSVPERPCCCRPPTGLSHRVASHTLAEPK